MDLKEKIDEVSGQGVDAIEGFFKEQIEREGFGGKAILSQILGKAKWELERRKKKEELLTKVSESTKDRIIETTLVSNDVLIAKVNEWTGTKANKETEEILYQPIVKGKTSNRLVESFDEALVLALVLKNDIDKFATEAISRILKIR